MQWAFGKNSMKEVLGSTLIQKIRDAESEFMSNKIYKKVYPKGLPAKILTDFEKQIMENDQ